MAELARFRHEGRRMIEGLARKHRTPVRDIVGRYNDVALVAIRAEFIKWATGLGMGSVTIARMIGRDHSTVLYHRNGWRQRKYAAAKTRAEARDGG